MSKASSIELGELMASKSGSVDPANYPDEIFDLYSIPAFDSGHPEIVPGRAIGSAKQVVKVGDVLLSRIVPHIRRSWIVSNGSDRRTIASGEWIVFRSDRVSPSYLRHVLVGDLFHSEFMRTVTGVGGSLLRARPAYVAKIKIPLPSMAEQHRIADMLDRAEALRAKRRAGLAQLDTLTQSIFLDLFGDPAKSGKNWPQVRLGEVTELVTGYPFRSEEYIAAGEIVKLCRGANILPKRLDWSDLACWPSSRVPEVSGFSLSEGDVLLAMDRPWISEGLKVAQVAAADLPALLVQRVARLRSKNGLSNEFIFQLLNQPSFTRHCRPTETTVPHISPTDIRSFTFHLPPESLQRDFVRRIAQIDELRNVCRASLTRMDGLFATLQHGAFRGEL